jgi:uncharacterized phiE125 gp8 family phage protein
MGLQLITAAADSPVTLDELKNRLRIDSTDFDGELQLHLDAAVSHVQEITRRSLITTEWKLTLPRFPRGQRPIVLPKGETQAVSEITYLDDEGDRQTLDDADYIVGINTEPATIVPSYDANWPSHREILNSIEITFTAGYGDAAEDVPADLRNAILLHAMTAFNGPAQENSLGGTDTAQQRALRGLIDKYKILSDDIADVISS